MSDGPAPLMQLASLSVRHGPRAVLRDVSLGLDPGECVGLIGPNGAGKTSLMRAAFGLIPHEGRSSLAALPAGVRAAHAAFLPQTRTVAWPVTVRDLVALGLLPYRLSGEGLRAEQARRVEAALAQMELTALQRRSVTTLSGGELARALLARVLVQETPLIVADEPAAGLDPAHQIALMQRLRALADGGRGVLVSLHDLSLAARHCTRLVMMHDGRVVADGPPMEVLTPDRLARVFGLRAEVIETASGVIVHPVALAGGPA